MTAAKITLYSTDCPRCRILKKKLDAANLAYTVCTDTEKMLAMGLREAPVLEIGEVRYDFTHALEYLAGLEAQNAD